MYACDVVFPGEYFFFFFLFLIFLYHHLMKGLADEWAEPMLLRVWKCEIPYLFCFVLYRYNVFFYSFPLYFCLVFFLPFLFFSFLVSSFLVLLFDKHCEKKFFSSLNIYVFLRIDAVEDNESIKGK